MRWEKSGRREPCWFLYDGLHIAAIAHPDHDAKTMCGFLAGNPGRGWNFYVYLERDSRGIKGTRFKRRDEAMAAAEETYRVLNASRARLASSEGEE